MGNHGVSAVSNLGVRRTRFLFGMRKNPAMSLDVQDHLRNEEPICHGDYGSTTSAEPPTCYEVDTKRAYLEGNIDNLIRQ